MMKSQGQRHYYKSKRRKFNDTINAKERKLHVKHKRSYKQNGGSVFVHSIKRHCNVKDD